MYAVPSTYRSFHSCPEEPKSYAPSVLGIILELTSALNTTLSVAASPRTIFPSVPAANVTTPTKYELPVTDNPPPTFTLFSNVVIPVTFKVSLMLVISSSVLPSTSKSPLASMAPTKVDTPATFTSSSSVCPSTSKSPLASMLPVNVEFS